MRNYLSYFCQFILFSCSFFTFNGCWTNEKPSSISCQKYFGQKRSTPHDYCQKNLLPDSLKVYETLIKDLGTRKITVDTIGDEIELALKKITQLNKEEFYLPLSQIQKHYGEFLYSQGDAASALIWYQKAEEVLSQRLATRCDSIGLSNIYSFLGLGYYNLSQFNQAVFHLEKGLQLNQVLGIPEEIALDLSNLSLPYLGMGAYEQALEYSAAANCIWEQFGVQKEDKEKYIAAKLNYGVAKYELGKQHFYKGERGQCKQALDESLATFQSAINIVEADTLLAKIVRHNIAIRAFFNLGVNYSFRSYLSPADLTDIRPYEEIFAYIEEMPDNAVKDFYKSIGNMLMSVLQAEVGNCKSAEKSIKESINLALLSIKDANNVSDAYTNNKRFFAQALLVKARTKEICYRHSQDLRDLEQAMNNYLALIGFVENVRNGFAEETLKANLMNTVYLFYTGAISVAIKLYQETGLDKHLDTAFQLCDKSKSVLLNEELQDKFQLQSMAKNHPFKPFLIKEKSFQSRLSILQQKMSLAAQKKDLQEVDIIRDSLIAIGNKYQKYLSSLQNGSKTAQNYYQTKENNPLPSISTIQENWLDPNTAIIAYEFGVQANSCFAFVITKNDKTVIPIEMDSTLFGLIENYSVSLQDTLGYYHEEAHDLYLKIFAPIQNLLPESIKRLVLVPEGVINNVVFQALLTESTTNQTPYKELPYLLNQYDIAYLPSLSVYTILEKLNRTTSTTNDFAGFIANPGEATTIEIVSNIRTSKEQKDFLSQNTIPMMDSITKLIHTRYFPKQFINPQATKESFRKNAPEAKILQLTAHGSFNQYSDSTLNYIAFLPTEKDNGRLTMQELYGLTLNADIVVLSSCNSNNGFLYSSEGTMSFSRAFFHTGCKATIATTSDVEEEKAAWITNQFYYFMMEKNFPPHQALAAAQRKYLDSINDLQSQDIKAHPSYWANYRHNGIDALNPTYFSNQEVE